MVQLLSVQGHVGFIFLGDMGGELGDRYQHVHKQPFRVYLYRGHGGDLGTRRQGVGINKYINNHLGFIFLGDVGDLGLEVARCFYSLALDHAKLVKRCCFRQPCCVKRLKGAVQAQARQFNRHKQGRIPTCSYIGSFIGSCNIQSI